MKVFSLIFLGPQGSGKGTQAKLLAEKANLVVIDAGATLREMSQENTALGRRIAQTINAGHLVEPELMAQVIQEKLLKISPEQGIIIDGFPRNLKQCELLRTFWPATKRGDYQVIFIDLPVEEAINRLSNRLTCSLCGETYVAGTVESCQKCGGTLVQREDDTPDAIRQRLEIFNNETLPVVEEFEREGRVMRVDGSPSVETVHQEIINKLGLDL